MSGIFSGEIFNPAIFNTGTAAPTGFIPRGSVAAIAEPVTATAVVTVPVPTATVTVPNIAEAEVT